MRVGASLVIGIVFCLACSEEEIGLEWSGPPHTAPEFELNNLIGNSVRLSDLRGKVVVIDFWATWCAPCIRQIPVLNKFYLMKQNNVTVLGVSVDVGNRDKVAAFVEKHGIRYEVLLGSESLAQQFGALGYPALFIVEADGTIASVHHGVISDQDLMVAVDSSLHLENES